VISAHCLDLPEILQWGIKGILADPLEGAFPILQCLLDPILEGVIVISMLFRFSFSHCQKRLIFILIRTAVQWRARCKPVTTFWRKNYGT
jgi:hypothetical protein